MILTHLVFDLETLGLREDCVILSLGCVPFEFENPKPFANLVKGGIVIKFNVEEQIKKYKRRVDPKTVSWWKSQGGEAKAILKSSSTDKTVVNGLTELSEWIKSTNYNGKSYIWSRGSYFDFPKIEHLYESADLIFPVNTWKIRDIKTYADILQGRDDGQWDRGLNIVGNNETFIKHNCLHDAAHDACAMQLVYNELTEIPF
jgi:hypothetical protein